jgi:hypothetical protein
VSISFELPTDLRGPASRRGFSSLYGKRAVNK